MSHVHALRRALTDDERRQFRVEDLNQGFPGITPFALRDWLARFRIGRVDVLCLSLGGNFHNQIGLFNHPQPFRLTPEGGDGQFVSDAMMAQLFAVTHAQFLDLGRRFAALFPARRRIVIAPPPPLGDAAHVQKHPGKLRPLMQHGVAPDGHRLALYAHQCAVYRDHAAKLEALYLPAPEAAMDARGFLKPDYFNTDPTHGNAAYGRLVLDQIAASGRQA